MIIFSNESILPVLLATPDKYFVLNLFSPINMGTSLTGLFPPKELLSFAPYDSEEFEKIYLNYILTNENAFQDLVEIMMSHYYNTEVIVLTDFDSSVIEPMMDCIIKLIKKRYGYGCSMVQELSDLYSAKESELTVDGENIFMQDKEWYVRKTVDVKKLQETIELAGAESDKYI